MKKKIIDRIDILILNRMLQEANISNKKLAGEIGLSPPAMLVRMRNLHKNRIIQRIRAQFNPSYFGFNYEYILFITINEPGTDIFLGRVRQTREITLCLETNANIPLYAAKRFFIKLTVKSANKPGRIIKFLTDQIDVYDLEISVCINVLKDQPISLAAKDIEQDK